MTALLGLHVALALAAPAAARRLGPRVLLLCALAPAATLAWAVTRGAGVLDGAAVTERLEWIPDLGLEVTLRLDAFAMLMVALIAGVGVLVLVYGRWYFSPRPGLGRFAGIFTAFAGSMLGIVLADNLLLLYVFWELTSVTSYLLIGFEDEKGEARSAALQAILVTGAGGLAMLAGFVLLAQAAGTYSLSAILAEPPSGGAAGVGLVLVLVGAFTKSAQVPFHSWLPGAMAAPTPVSAYLHSATMVKAGVYLIARLTPAFAPLHPFWRPLVVGVGVTTMVVGGYRALRQHDLKLLLAHGTVSQLGFMVALFGAGRADLSFAGAAMVLAHGLFKAALFLVVGIVDHQAHTRDLRTLSGLGRRMPGTFAVATVAAASMAGVFPLLGFVAKESAFEGLIHALPGPLAGLALGGVAVASVLTVAYAARFVWGGFAVKTSSERDHVDSEVPSPAWQFVAPTAVLAVLTVVLGLLPHVASGLVEKAGASLDPRAAGSRLYLWHGFTAALGLSMATLGLGVLLFAAREAVERVQDRLWRVPSAEGMYESSLVALNQLSTRVTGMVQSGSLPIYLAVILLTVLALPGVALLTQARLPSDVRLAESPLQAVVGVLVAGAAMVTAVARRRLVAVLFLGAVGFGVAVLFVMQGAPDLALTQFLVETLAVVIFVLVLRHLPTGFATSPWRAAQAGRLALAAAVGTFVASFSLVAAAARRSDPVSQAYVERAVPEAGGRNVVNVILVDFRALDTLGEITVLVAAALGIISLLVAARPGREHDA